MRAASWSRRSCGCDFLRLEEEGLIEEFCVMVRPLSAARALADAMARQFERITHERGAGRGMLVTDRPQRADAQRNVESLLQAASEAFAQSGVDAPPKQIAERAGVGVGTLYRHFPKRSDLVLAVLEHEVQACVEAGQSLRTTLEPADALTQWIGRYTDFVATKRGLAAALHSGDPTFDGLGHRLLAELEPTAADLLTAATDAGAIRGDLSANDLLRAVAHLCAPGPDEVDFSQRMVALLLDGLRCDAVSTSKVRD